MKFLIDAHLPPSLRAVFQAAGHDAIHTLDLPDQNASRDGQLNEVSIAEMRVVVTKDTDFYYSHLLHGRPWKLVLVRTGNMGLRATKLMFETHLPEIETALQQSTFVEVDQFRVSAANSPI
jgi:predicted nuclease of predicted toxin-antitoxin system